MLDAASLKEDLKDYDQLEIVDNLTIAWHVTASAKLLTISISQPNPGTPKTRARAIDIRQQFSEWTRGKAEYPVSEDSQS